MSDTGGRGDRRWAPRTGQLLVTVVALGIVLSMVAGGTGRSPPAQTAAGRLAVADHPSAARPVDTVGAWTGDTHPPRASQSPRSVTPSGASAGAAVGEHSTSIAIGEPPAGATGTGFGAVAGTTNHTVARCEGAYTYNADRFWNRSNPRWNDTGAVWNETNQRSLPWFNDTRLLGIDAETTLEPDERVLLTAWNSSVDWNRSFDSDSGFETAAWNRTATGTWDGPYAVETLAEFITNGSKLYSYPPGEYDPRVRLAKDVGGAAAVIIETYLATCPHLSVAADQAPTARLDWSPSSPTPGRQVTFDASASSDPQGTVELYGWDFDADGTVDRYTTAPTATHTYSTPGPKNVTLTVYTDDYDDRFNQYEDDSGTVRSEPTTYDSTSRQLEVQTANEPPDASFTASPRPAVTTDRVTLDASGSSDPDGSVAHYRWDFDGDGTVDRTTTMAVITHRFAYDTTRPGLAQIHLEVVDDDGATDTARTDLELTRPELTVSCRVADRTVAPGEEVLLSVTEAEQADTFQYARDATGAFRDPTERRQATVVYDAAGTYTPRVRARDEASDRVAVADCPSVSVEATNTAPTAVLTYRPSRPATGSTVTLDASNSTDPDGTIQRYRWDLDDDGVTERVTNRPTVTLSPGEAGDRAAAVVVVDDDGATDDARSVIPVVGGIACRLPVPVPCSALLPPLVIGGLLLCRLWRRVGGPVDGGGRAGIVDHTTGTFATPSESGTVSVTGLGFEPDLLLFTATTTATDGGPPVRTDGWSYGKAARTADGTVTQNVLSVADDARQADAGVGVVRTDAAVEVLVHDDAGASGLLGAVEATTPDGFEVGFDASALPEDHAAGGATVLFQAFGLAEDADVAVGHAAIPATTETQSLPIEFAADHAILTATDAVATVDDQRVTGRPLGVSHGEAVVGAGGVTQQTVTSSVDPARVDRNSYAASGERVLHLLGGSDDDPEAPARTTARLTGLDGAVELTYDEVTAPGMVTYVAVDAGERSRPVVGHFDLPAPEGDDRMTIDVGFEPAVVEFVTCNVDAVSGTRTVDESPLSFGWAHGSARMTDGNVTQHLLHGARSATGPPPGGEGGRAAGGRADGGRLPGRAGATRPSRPAGPADAVATALVVGADGHILGRDEVRVTGTTPTGFSVAVADVSTHERGEAAERRPIVFYKAWPPPGGDS